MKERFSFLIHNASEDKLSVALSTLNAEALRDIIILAISNLFLVVIGLQVYKYIQQQNRRKEEKEGEKEETNQNTKT